ncbi:MAG: hypothetical protein V1735_01010 [Nanoarchaeota archaeon]
MTIQSCDPAAVFQAVVQHIQEHRMAGGRPMLPAEDLGSLEQALASSEIPRVAAFSYNPRTGRCLLLVQEQPGEVVVGEMYDLAVVPKGYVSPG